MGSYVECRTCLGTFNDNDTVHIEAKVFKQKNVSQAIEEFASIKVLKDDGLPKYICTNCLKSLETSINFRIKVISSDTELKRRLSPVKISLGVCNDLHQITDENQYAQKNENVKEETEELGKKENRPGNIQIKGNNYTSSQCPEQDSDSDWNDFNDDNNLSDNYEETENKPSLRKPKIAIKKGDDIEIDSADSSKEEIKNTISLDTTNKKSPSFQENGSDCIEKPLVKPEKEWSDSNWDNDSLDDIFNEKPLNKSSLKSSNKKSIAEPRTVRRKRRVKKRIKDISDTSDSDGDSDIPLEELRKEIKDLKIKTEHKVRTKREKKEKVDGPRLCPICGKLFKARQNFSSHMTTVHRKPEKPEKVSCLCPDCGRVITGTRQNFVAHRRYHHSDKAQVKKRFTCDVCPRKFYREKNLIIHQRIHNGEKGYVCELCPDKSYTQIGGLILHKRKVHLKKPTCTCNYCGKQFYEKHYLETHIRQWHTGERPFSCEICGKSFSCNGTLLRHRKDSHGEKQPCPKCGKMYTEGELRKHLKRHKIREEGIKRKKYTCEYCGTEMNFTSRKRHLLKQHGIMLRGRGETAERVPISRADAM